MRKGLYRSASYLKSALWTIPFIAILLVLGIAPVLRSLDGRVAGFASGLGVAGARALYETVITLTLSFLVFTFGSLLVALPIASGQLTPRIIAPTLLGDRVLRYSIGLFVFSLTFAVTALDRLETTVHEISTLVTAGLGIACLAAFLFLIDHAARLLRPVSILDRVGDAGVAAIESVYPRQSSDSACLCGTSVDVAQERPRIVHHMSHAHIVLAVDYAMLARAAQRSDGVIEVVPQVGDFVAGGEPLLVLYGGAVAIDDRLLRRTFTFGAERTMQQDPLFAFRIIVDIALKALSPAINDPTTAVLALDQIHRLLRVVGARRLTATALTDDRGYRRLIYRTPNWDDFVSVACIEIRRCGAGHVQIARRLRAIFDDLIASLPPARHEALERESRELTQMLQSLYALPDDRAMAFLADVQGLGGSGKRLATNV